MMAQMMAASLGPASRSHWSILLCTLWMSTLHTTDQRPARFRNDTEITMLLASTLISAARPTSEQERLESWRNVRTEFWGMSVLLVSAAQGPHRQAHRRPREPAVYRR